MRRLWNKCIIWLRMINLIFRKGTYVVCRQLKIFQFLVNQPIFSHARCWVKSVLPWIFQASFRMNKLIEYGNSPNETLVNFITKFTNITFITMLLILSLVELSFDWLLNTNDCNWNKSLCLKTVNASITSVSWIGARLFSNYGWTETHSKEDHNRETHLINNHLEKKIKI